VSIVVPTFNAGAHIERLAESIRHQTYQNIEVTIVDNFSRDQAVLDHLNLEAAIIYAASGMAEARNIGALRSRGSYLLHLDADMELSPTLVAECVRICELGLADAIIIPEVSAGTGFWATCAGLQKVLSRGVDGYEGTRFLSREAFDSTGGFDPDLEAGEDFDFYFRLERQGHRISRTTSVIFHHLGRLSFSEILAKYRRYGLTVPRLRAKYGASLVEKKSFVRLVVRRWRFLANDPAHAAGFILLCLLAKISEA